MRRRSGLAAVAAIVLWSAGCGDDDTTSSSTSTITNPSVVEEGTHHLQPLPPYEQAPIPEGFEPDMVVRDIWYLAAVDDDDETIHVGVPAVCGSRLSEFTVELSPEVVAVTAWVETFTSEIYMCPAPLGVMKVSLRLPEPLAGRDLAGNCEPGDATVEQRMCRGLADLMATQS